MLCRKTSSQNFGYDRCIRKTLLPDFGGDVRGQLFELADKGKSSIIRQNIEKTINSYEPRAKILDLVVDLQPDRHSLNVTIKFEVVNTEETVEFTTVLNRLR